MRLNLGSGLIPGRGWVNVDLRILADVDVTADGRALPFRDGAFTCAVTNHSLCEIEHRDVPIVLAELRRVLAPGAPLRVLVADIVAAFGAWSAGDHEWFLNRHPSLDETFCAYVTWYSTRRSIFTPRYLDELLTRAGFATVVPADFGETGSDEPGIVELDHRKRESLIVEARA